MPGEPRTATLTVREIADLVEGQVSGDAAVAIRGVSTLADAASDQIALFAVASYSHQVPTSRAGALLVSAGLDGGLDDPRPRVVGADGHAALIPLLSRLHPEPRPRPGVDPTAVLARGAMLGADVEVGPYAMIGEGAAIGDRVRIGAHTVVGARSQVGADSVLHPHVTLQPGVLVGERVVLHPGVRLGADGFGFVTVGGRPRKVPQTGRCIIEDDVEIGANTCVDRGSIGDTVIGRGTKVDNLVQVGHNVRIGPNCVIAAQVGIAGSTKIGAGVMIGGQSGVNGHIVIGDGARLGGATVAYQDVPPGTSVVGHPAVEHTLGRRVFALLPRLPDLFKRLRALERRATVPAESGREDGGQAHRG